MTTTDEAAARLTREIADCRGQGYIDASLVRLSLGDVAQVLAANAALRDQLARVAEALYDEVRHPINAKGSAWTDEEIRYYLSAKWGLTIPPEVEAARLARVGLTWAELAARTPTPGAAGEVG